MYLLRYRQSALEMQSDCLVRGYKSLRMKYFGEHSRARRKCFSLQAGGLAIMGRQNRSRLVSAGKLQSTDNSLGAPSVPVTTKVILVVLDPTPPRFSKIPECPSASIRRARRNLRPLEVRI